MRRKFRVRIGEKTFDVEVEEVTESETLVRPAGPTPTIVPAALEVTPKNRLEAVTAESGIVRAPLPGRVVTVRVKEGDMVRAGDAVLVLESMKMENEIVAPRSGAVRKIHVGEQASVNYGDMLVEIE